MAALTVLVLVVPAYRHHADAMTASRAATDRTLAVSAKMTKQDQEKLAGLKAQIEKDKEHLREFLKSGEPFVAEVKGLNARIDGGINYRQLADKLQSVVDAHAQIGQPPTSDVDADLFVQQATTALSSYRTALEQWSNAIEEPLLKRMCEESRDRALTSAALAAQLTLRAYERMRSRAE